MRKLTGLFIFLLSTALLFTAMNRVFINRIKQDRYFNHLNPGDANRNSLYHRLFVRSDRWAYGDLYGLSYLPGYRFKLAPFTKYPYYKRPATQKVLYIIGDSFLADKTLTRAFNSFDNVIYLDRRFPFGPMVLDSTRQNYLMLEFAERNLNNFIFAQTSETKWTNQDIRNKHNYGVSVPAAAPGYQPPPSLLNRLGKIIFNKDLSRNLELLLFDDTIFTPFKELKAQLNYKLLNRVANEVAVSTDQKRLFLNVSVDTASTQSAFKEVPPAAVNKLTAELTKASNYYHQIGFKGVYLSVIPNAVSIYDAGRMPYNHLLQKVEAATTLPVISIYQPYKTDKQNLFYLSDAHWNPYGFSVWVKQVDTYFNHHLN